MSGKQRLLHVISWTPGFVFSFIVSQTFCYFVFDDIIVDLMNSPPVIYIIIRLFIAITLFVIIQFIRYRKISKIQIDIIFVLYLMFIVALLFLKSDPRATREININLDPLSLVKDFRKSNNSLFLLIVNIVLYIPVGIYLRYRFPNQKRKMIMILFVFPLITETIQLLTKVGVFDINDIILNFTGSILGLLGYQSIMRRKKKV